MMKAKILFYQLIILMLLSSTGCFNGQNSKNQKLNIKDMTIDDLHKYIGLDLDSLKHYEGISIKKEIEEGDDGSTWRSIKYLKGKEVIISFESNWENKSKVYRITILSPVIKFDSLYVDQNFSKIKGIFSQEIPTVEDGLLFLNLKKYPYVSVEFDISNNQNNAIYYKLTDLNKMPDTLKVKTIVVMN